MHKKYAYVYIMYIFIYLCSYIDIHTSDIQEVSALFNQEF